MNFINQLKDRIQQLIHFGTAEERDEEALKMVKEDRIQQRIHLGTAEARDKAALKMVKEDKNVGIYIDFFTWNNVVRSVASVLSGLFMASLILLVDSLIGADLVDFWHWLAFVALFGYLVGKGETTIEVVPEGRMAMVTWFGIPFRVYRQAGEYAWTGKRFRFGRVNTVKEPMTDPSGFFWTQVVQVAIWNVYEDNPAKRTSILEAITKSGSAISANLLLMIQMRDPMLWIRINDPMMDIGERARMSFRTAVSFFTGKDVVSVKNLLTEMMSGYVVLTCFIKKQVGTLAKHSLIRSNGGDPMFESVRPKENLFEETRKFQDDLEEDADQAMLAEVAKKENKPVIEVRCIKESLEEVLHACGVTLVRASIGFVGLPEEVVKAANQADAQPYQLATQRASAQAAKEARDLLRPEDVDINDPTFADRQAYAAASDPDSRVEVIHVSGGSNGGDALGIQRAAAVLASTMKKGTKK